MDDNEASMDRHRFTGEMLSPGAASGRLVFLQSDFTLLGPDQRRATGIEQELDRFEEHIDGLAEELGQMISALEAEAANYPSPDRADASLFHQGPQVSSGCVPGNSGSCPLRRDGD